MRRLKELRKISKILYREVAFRFLLLQASYVPLDYYEQHEQPAPTRKLSIHELPKKVEKLFTRLFAFFKILTLIALMLVIVSSTIYIMSLPAQAHTWEHTIILSSVFLLAMFAKAFILFFLTIPQAAVLYHPKIYQPLLILDLSDREIATIMALTFWRMFNTCLIGSIAISLIAFLVLGNILAGVLYITFLTATYVLVLWLVNAIPARYLQFYAPTKTKAQQTLKILLILGYTVVLSFFFLIPYTIFNVLSTVTSAFLAIPEAYQKLIVCIPPLSSTYLVALVYLKEASLESFIFPSISAIFYLLLSAYSFRSLLRTFASIPYMSIPTTIHTETVPTAIKTRPSLLGHITKDLKLILRDPSHAVTFFLGPVSAIIFSQIRSLFQYPSAWFYIMAFIIATSIRTLSVSLLTVEKEGLRFLLSLPVSYHDIAKSKAFVAVLSYIILALSATAVFAILQQSYFILGVGLLLNSVGIFTYSYKILRKAINYTLETRKLILNEAKLFSSSYLMALEMLFIVIPVIVICAGIEFGFLYYALAIVLALQAIFFVMYKL
ncbi:MAG: hypothetical protein NDP13_05940 [Crenarchaeota archaeon]|nr:hypothetical protein [Thermoproteota archaeon]MCR8501502.1 hypothetical protein [Thermoproteota archaeon]